MFIKLCNAYNYSNIPRTKNVIRYIVIHFTANDGDTARNNLDYFARGIISPPASAHFFVDENEVCCSVPWDCTAYHCGTSKGYKHKSCRNSNSIGIEMCSRKDSKGNYYFKDETIRNCAKFTAQQMKNYNIPLENVLRHYDVTGKNCPAPMVINPQLWANFKALVWKYYKGEETPQEVDDVQYYEKLEEIPAGELRETVKMLVSKGVIKGNGTGLHLTHDMVRMFVFNNRAGLYK